MWKRKTPSIKVLKIIFHYIHFRHIHLKIRVIVVFIYVVHYDVLLTNIHFEVLYTFLEVKETFILVFMWSPEEVLYDSGLEIYFLLLPTHPK